MISEQEIDRQAGLCQKIFDVLEKERVDTMMGVLGNYLGVIFEAKGMPEEIAQESANDVAKIIMKRFRNTRGVPN